MLLAFPFFFAGNSCNISSCQTESRDTRSLYHYQMKLSQGFSRKESIHVVFVCYFGGTLLAFDSIQGVPQNDL